MDTTNLTAVVRLRNVTRIERRGIGPIHRGIIDLRTLHSSLERSMVLYAPRYQRGFRKDLGDVPESRFDQLLPIFNEELQIDPNRADVMAVKYLQGRLYTTHITWNARKVPGLPEPEFNEDKKTLLIETIITVPDTGHRHRAYYELVNWKDHPEDIPVEVIVDGRPVSEDEIRAMLQDFIPEQEFIYVDIYNLSADQEGKLYDEFNADQKAPSGAVAIDLNQDKTPSRQFIYRLMAKSPIFARDELELRQNTIGSKSRKLTTNATLESAVRPETKRLAALEKEPERYDNLLDFTAAFFDEWSQYYPAWKPNASADARHGLRETSFALSNIMLHPLLRVIFRLWDEYQTSGTDWQQDQRWKEVIARIAGKVTNTEKPDEKISAMSRKNPAWKGKVLIEARNKDNELVWSLSSTRQTREAAFQYLCELGEIDGKPTQTKQRAAA